MKFLVRVRRVIVETAEIEVEAPDEESAWAIERDDIENAPAEWLSGCLNDSDYEVDDVSEMVEAVDPMATTKLRQAPYPASMQKLEAFEDISWGNDCSDSLCFSVGGLMYLMLVEVEDQSEREMDDALRYWIARYDVEEGIADHDNPLLSTDDPAAVLAWIETKKESTP